MLDWDGFDGVGVERDLAEVKLRKVRPWQIVMSDRYDRMSLVRHAGGARTEQG